MRVYKALYRLYRYVFVPIEVTKLPEKVKPMLENQIYFDKLKSLLRLFPDLTWTSESDAKIEAVKLPWYRIWSKGREKDGTEWDRLNGQIENDRSNPGMSALRQLIAEQDNLISLKLTDKKQPAKKTLYILTRFGVWYYVGIKTTLIET